MGVERRETNRGKRRMVFVEAFQVSLAYSSQMRDVRTNRRMILLLWL